jgi:hypothetical protein
MCGGCGRPAMHDEPWTDDMHRALELIRELYATRDGIIGGPLHVQLDDGNLYDDQSFNHRPVDYDRRGYGQWEDEPTLRRICDELLPLLMSIPEDARFTTLMAFHKDHYGHLHPDRYVGYTDDEDEG